jgi:hypothetical protein
MRYLLAFGLVSLVVLGRVLTPRLHLPWNIVPVGAIAIYAGARLSRRVAIWVPILGMLVTDLVLNTIYGLPLFSPNQAVSYATLGLVAAVFGPLASEPRALVRTSLAIGSALLFYLTTNFAAWMWPYSMADGTATIYARDWTGLMSSYIAGLPFLRNPLLSEVIGVTLLFGAEAIANVLGARFQARATASENAG